MLIKCCCNFYKYIWDFFQIFLFPCFQRFKFEDYVQFNTLGLWLSSTVYSKFSIVVGVKKFCTCTLLCFFCTHSVIKLLNRLPPVIWFFLFIDCFLLVNPLHSRISIHIHIFFFRVMWCFQLYPLHRKVHYGL